MFSLRVCACRVGLYSVVFRPHKRHCLCVVSSATVSCLFSTKVPSGCSPKSEEASVVENNHLESVRTDECDGHGIFLISNLTPKPSSGQLYSARESKRPLKYDCEMDGPPNTSKRADVSHIIDANSSSEQIEEFAERLVEACRQKELKEGSGIKRDTKGNEDIESQKTNEFKSRHVNRFRKIIYNEGELDHSDLSLPPSRSNPHPFDPSLNPDLLPPTHSRSLAQYVNHLPLLQNLVKLGVNLFLIEKTTAIGKEIIKLDWETDVLPKLAWLIDLGVPVTKLGDYLTRNPFFLLQSFDDMKARVNYLRSKRFTKAQIAKVIVNFRYWLNFDVRVIDGRLGWIQKSFKLSGNEVRKVIDMEPRILAFGIGPVKRLCMLFSEEFAFSEAEIKTMLMKEPRLFIQNASQVAASYIYAHFIMGLTNAQIAEYPLIIRCPITYLERRHEFLVRMKRNKYVPGTEGYVPLDAFLHPSDKYFAVKVARSFLVSYNSFIKRV